VYLPHEVLERNGYSMAEFEARSFTPAFVATMREAVEVARKLFLEGLPLVATVHRRLAFDLELFSRGGMRILDKIERQGYNVFERRPAISKVERVGLLFESFFRIAFPRAA
jgi:phytoene/squalene synthetase